MKLTLTALFDDDTRAQIKEQVLGEARSIARSAIDNEVNAEIKRVGRSLYQRWTNPDWTVQDQMRKAIKEAVLDRWDGLKNEIVQVAIKAVDDAVAEKLKTKTVWEAQKQDAYIRKVFREEMKSLIGGGMQ